MARQYDYEAPSYEEALDRAERKGSMFDALFKDSKLWRPAGGANIVRILPRPSPAKHYGLILYLHRGVGPNDRTYLCLRENESSPYSHCPICDELYDLGPRATKEDKDLLRPKAQVAYYIVDRQNEKEGVQIWLASTTTDSEIALQSVSRRNKSVLRIVDPDNGYDVEFTRTGQGRNNTRYKGFQVSRDPSPIGDDDRDHFKWLDTAFDTPLDKVLNFYPPEHIEKVFYGRAAEERGNRRERGRDRDRDNDGDGDGDRDRDNLRRTRTSARDADGDERTDERSRDRTSRRDRDDRDAEPDREHEEPPRRTRPRDDTRDADPEPERRRTRERPDRDRDADPEPDREREEPRRRTRGADADEGGGNTRRSRSTYADDLDDEIPSDAGRRRRPNGRDDGEPAAEGRRARENGRDADERGSRGRDRDEPERGRERTRRARPNLDDDDTGSGDTGDTANRRGSGQDEDNSDRRQRMRDRLQR